MPRPRKKELETMWAAPELLGAPTISRGSARSRGGGGGGHRSQISLQSHPKYMKTMKKSTTFISSNYYYAYIQLVSFKRYRHSLCTRI